MSPNRVPSWTNFGDERDDEDGPSADDAPAILRLDPAGPPSVRQQSQEASLYLTRSNPYTFLSSEADARRLASTSRWLIVDTVGFENIREKYGDDAIPEDYEPNPDADPTLGDDSDAEEDAVGAAAEDSDGDGGGVTTDLEGEAETDGQEYTRAELKTMEWPKLRSLAKDSDHEDIDGRSSKEEIINALAVDVDSEDDSASEAADADAEE